MPTPGSKQALELVDVAYDELPAVPIQIVADILGLNRDMIAVSFTDMDVTPYDTSTTASRSTFHMGNAVRRAAMDARQQLITLAAPILRVDRDVLQLRKGTAINLKNCKQQIEGVLAMGLGFALTAEYIWDKGRFEIKQSTAATITS
ncbi:molybdopterin cofactor-binding domain-containing protein [Thermodesulfobacteriota bacterium]